MPGVDSKEKEGKRVRIRVGVRVRPPLPREVGKDGKFVRKALPIIIDQELQVRTQWFSAHELKLRQS